MGFDLRGGVELRYKIERVLTEAEKEELEKLAKKKKLSPSEREEARRERLDTKVTDTVAVIRKRLDPDDALQPDIRPEAGGEIVIRLQGLSQAEVDHIKKLAEDMGFLEFRMVVKAEEYKDLDEEARKDIKLMRLVHPKTEDSAERVENLYIRLKDDYNVEGKNIKDVRSAPSRYGMGVAFELDQIGSKSFAKITKHLADKRQAGEAPERLAILLNGKLQSAPTVSKEITGGNAIIENIPSEHIKDTIAILKAGSLPTRLIYQSEIFIGPALGSDSLKRGRTAIILSMMFVLVFMCVYYARSGFIANFAVLLNLLFIGAVIMMSESVLTLPGIAGIVLTVGMSVDANVLIYERIREERAKGKVLRFAIKNGYDRALWTIVDANLTTLITAIVLWIFLIGPVRWFAVTLSIGILSSMFTSLFVTRVVFDLLVGAGFIKELHMLRLVSEPKLHFVKWAPKLVILSTVILVVGMVAFISRGRENLGIEFTSGTACQLQLTESMNITEVRNIVRSLGYDNAQVVTASQDANEIGKTESDQFVIRVPQTSADQTQAEREEVLSRIEKAFGDRVPTRAIIVEFERAVPIEDASDPFTGGSLVSIRFKTKREILGPSILAPIPPEEEDETTPATPETPATVTPETPTTETVTTEAAPQESKTILEPVSLKPDLIEEALAKTGLGRFELVRSEKQRFYFTAEFKTTETDAKRIERAVTAEGLITVPDAFVYKQFVGPAQAHKMVLSAVFAILVSMVFIVIYIWVRFGNVRYGFAAIVALAHDILFSLGAIALAGFIAGTFFGDLLRIGEVNIDLTIVAAILTIIGYSLNDTIVVFDRIRENLGRRRELTAELIDRSVNQTISRTLLTSLTTLIVCLTLYIAGGRQLHGLAFCLIIGVLVGTYSSVFIASPLLVIAHGGVAEDRSGGRSGRGGGGGSKRS